MLDARDIESIERATLAAVSPAEIEPFAGWLLAFDAGSIGRARSAVPLSHAGIDASCVEAIAARYRARGLAPRFRIADAAGLEPVREELGRLGYRRAQPTLVQTAASAAMRAVSGAAPAVLANRPDAGWQAVFLGEGFDPVDGAHRVQALGRAPDALYASVREGGETLAVGMAAFGHGWASVHGMRTARARRGEGLAARVLAGLALASLERGLARLFLQVEEDNAAARSLYLRAGFTPAWCYAYWAQD